MASSKTPNEPSGQGAARTVVCPTCGGDSVYSPANRYRPFCSERCKQIDLGAWASEEHKIPVSPDAEDDLFSEDLPDRLH